MFFYLYLFIIGAAIGSFLNVVIDRLPFGKPLTGRSVCDHCGRKLSFVDLVPIFSFFYLKGKSRCCKKPLSFFYPLVEIVSAVSLPVIFFYFRNEPLIDRIVLSLVVFTLIAIFFTDAKYMIIPDELQVVLFFASFLYLLDCQKNLFFCSLETFGLSLFKGFFVALPVASIFYLTQGKGIGFADVKLAVNIGFLFGLKKGFLVLYLAFMLGGFIAVLLLLTRKKGLKSKIPFGPFLVISMLFFLFFQDQAVDLLLRFFLLLSP